MPHDSAQKSKVLFAAGGTGGHLFPAQALADKLSETEVLFAGAKLSTNSYFDRDKFTFHDIESTTPFRGNVLQKIGTLITLAKGVWQSLRLFSKERPDLIVGFGSFHSFPLLCAAILKRIPLVLFESNAIPGKVIRLFSRSALFTAVYFPESSRHLKGKVHAVEIPSLKTYHALNVQSAREALGLDPDLFTLLVFGGSQGSIAINGLILAILPALKQAQVPLQLIHLTGKPEAAKEIGDSCAALGIKSYVRDFESRMDLVWSAADVALCRSGAATLSELLHYAVPGILVPYPHAADQHQLKNARFVEEIVKGARVFEESSLSQKILRETIVQWALLNPERREEMRANIQQFNAQQKKGDLAQMLKEILRKENA